MAKSAIDALFDDDDSQVAARAPVVWASSLPSGINSQSVRSDVTVYELALGVLLTINANYASPSVELWHWLFERIYACDASSARSVDFEQLVAQLPAELRLSSTLRADDSRPVRQLFRLWMTWLADGGVGRLLTVFASEEHTYERPSEEQTQHGRSSRTPLALSLRCCVADADDTVCETRLAAASPLGLFVRRLELSFDQMPFDQRLQLADSLARFVRTPGSRIVMCVYLNREDDAYAQQTARLVEHSLGSRAAQHVRRLLDTDQRCVWTLRDRALHHYARFLCTVADNDNNDDDDDAEHQLHAYFDYAFALAGRSSHSSSSAANSAPFDSGEHLVPYAVLNLARLHLARGNVPDGLVAVHEAIRISQERQDRYCTAHALYCLTQLIEKLDDRTESYLQRQALAEYLAACPREHVSELARLNSLAAISSALTLPASVSISSALPSLKTVATSPGGANKALWELLYKVDRLAAAAGRYRPVFDGQVASRSKMVRATLWNTLGQTQLAHVHSLLRLYLYGPSSPAHDQCETVAALAWQHLSVGQVDAALALVAHTERRFAAQPHSTPPVLTAWKLRIRFELAFADRSIAAAYALLDQLQCALASHSSSHTDHELLLRRARLLAIEQQLDAAVACCHRLLAAPSLSVSDRLHTLFVLADVFIGAGVAAQALPLVVEAIATAQLCRHQLAHSHAVSMLASILVSLAQYRRAAALLAALPSVAQHSAFLRIQLAVLSAQCSIGQGSHDAAAAVLLAILPAARQCRVGFAATTPRHLLLQVVHLLALICDRQGQVQQRDAFSLECLQLLSSQ